MFNAKTSLLAGKMTRAQLEDALNQAQQAYIELSTGLTGVSFSYSQGDGTRSVTYQPTDIGKLMGLIQLLQAQLGIVKHPRRALRFRY
ncbi:gpW family head-tail joining protein [Yersinia pseudotuberculosis]|uniref:gpW family head-tail joining protein n=1 Tax=Yersinia pseudotuberculosis TaxID=633 RepID=UPI0005AD25E3|nr:gpW family head-tail joining protein [Yersinia pseudotuberculosis]AJJ72153.1 gpW family protein [Yersinia pseudotuberculosis]AYX13019.1 phage head-tail adapter protein [Yersinia pseudotuberculosis]MBO1567229.1 phage head-tail adapter protein [Yersinia pseudotuberculosis]MBO1604088.1 phage head-tail adapter protein [Yersinia pseudotuberculosis]CNI87648.1 gpW [Yersinia pseudotuberculosis]